MRRNRVLTQRFTVRLQGIVQRAVSLGYTLPSIECLRLYNKLFLDLYASFNSPANGSPYNSLDWLYILANDSGDNNFGRFNLIKPTEITTGSPVYNHKKGWNGTCNFNHSVSVPLVLYQTGNNSSGFYSTVGGAAGVVESVVTQNGANSQIVCWRHRTNPWIDHIHNATVASPARASPGAAANNTMYAFDNDNSGNRNTIWNNTTIYSSGAGGTGGLPDTSTLQMSGLTAPRITGMIWGGRGIYRNHGSTDQAMLQLITILNSYMTAVQALP